MCGVVSLGVNAIRGGIIGATVGTFTVPSVMTVAGGVGGTVLGGVAGFVGESLAGIITKILLYMWKIIHHILSIKLKFNLITVFFLSIGYMYLADYGSYNPKERGFYIAILWAIFVDVFMIFTFEKFYPKLLKKFSNNLEKKIRLILKENEKSLFESASNHLKGVEGVGGKLFLTDKRLVFKSHKLNIQNHEQEFDLSKIKKVETPNGKRLNFEYEGKLEKFVVEDPKIWVEKLKKFSYYFQL